MDERQYANLVERRDLWRRLAELSRHCVDFDTYGLATRRADALDDQVTKLGAQAVRKKKS